MQPLPLSPYTDHILRHIRTIYWPYTDTYANRCDPYHHMSLKRERAGLRIIEEHSRYRFRHWWSSRPIQRVQRVFDDDLDHHHHHSGQKEEKMKRRLTLPSSALLAKENEELKRRQRERQEKKEQEIEEGLASISSNHSTGSFVVWVKNTFK